MQQFLISSEALGFIAKRKAVLIIRLMKDYSEDEDKFRHIETFMLKPN